MAALLLKDIPREALIRCLSLSLTCSGPSHRAVPLQVRAAGGRPHEGRVHGQRRRPANQVGKLGLRGVTLEVKTLVRRISELLIWTPCDSEEEGKAIRRRTSLIPINLATLACHLVCLSRHRRTNKAATQRLLNQKRIEIMECFIGRK